MHSSSISRTAELAAYMRALAAREADSSIRCGDHLARHFLSSELFAMFIHEVFTDFIPSTDSSKTYRHAFPGLYYYHWARTRHFDTLLLRAVEQGIDQLVVLGAGYDTRAYRLRPQLDNVRIFELDLPAIQDKKTTILSKLFGSIPRHVIYIPLDFNDLTIKEALLAHGYEATARTFFSWEGVTCYLNEAAVHTVFDFVAHHSATNSSLVFDYVAQSVLDRDLSSYGADVIVPALATAAEPLLFGIDPNALENILAAHQLRPVSDFGARELEEHYLLSADGQVAGTIWECFRIAHAVVY